MICANIGALPAPASASAAWWKIAGVAVVGGLVVGLGARAFVRGMARNPRRRRRNPSGPSVPYVSPFSDRPPARLTSHDLKILEVLHQRPQGIFPVNLPWYGDTVVKKFERLGLVGLTGLGDRIRLTTSGREIAARMGF